MIGPCPYDCTNKSFTGYCKTTGCINPVYSNQTATAYEKEIGFEPVYNHTTTEGNRISLTLARDAYRKVKYSKENKTSLVLTREECQLILDLLETLI